MRRRELCIVLAGLAAGCGGDLGRGRAGPQAGLATHGASDTKGSSTDADDDGPSNPGGDTDPADPNGGATGIVRYDVGGGGTGGFDPVDTGCDKVDFLFVIDNSTSMHNEQAALVASYDDFMGAIAATVDADDYHVMVVDTDAETRCTPEACADGTPSNKVQELCLDPAGGYACEANFDDCDVRLGAGVVHPAGDSASNEPCSVSGGKRFLDGTDDLVGTFACTARVGTAGNPAERPMNAMEEALRGAGGCNDSFLRDDAILVVTFITDDPCYEDSGTPQAWYENVVAAKNGDADAVVVLGIIPSLDCHYTPDSCETPADAIGGAHWREFVGLWGDAGLVGDVCASESYPTLFAAAVSVIATTCDAFEPPG
jgi:hypothetical protein